MDQAVIGSKVLVKASTIMTYVKLDGDKGKSRRIALSSPIYEEMYLVGKVQRPRGIYHPSKIYHSCLNESDYEPAKLQITSTVLLYQCRKSMFSKIIEVQSQHIKII